MIKDRFFDREYYISVLEKRVSGLLEGYRQNIAIIGDELVGKTSIICKFLNRFYEPRVVTLYLELRLESLDSFARRFSGTLLYNFLAKSDYAIKEDLDFLMKKSERFIPKTVEKIRQILADTERRKRNNVFTELFSLCESIHQETGKYCLVILDEFHNLEEMGSKSLYREWSKLLLSQKSTMYVIISSMKFKARTILSKNLSLLFGNFEVINVEPFDIKTSEEYLDKKLQSSGLESAFKDFLVHFTGGFPFYLEVVSESLLKHSQNKLAEILENLLFDSSGILNQRFSNYLKRFQGASHSNDYISILHLVASGRNKVKDIAHMLKKQMSELNLRINKLLELDTLARTGDFLKINDRVFGFWLKFVYQERLHSLTFDAKNQKERFRRKLEEMMDEFYRSAQRPVIDRTTEILRLFENEVIQVEKKKIRLSHFREIKPLEFRNRRLKAGIIGRSSESLWIMGFKDEQLNEEDIAEFARECRKYRHKLQRKIIVTLKDIDANTRLRAMEEKIWTWDVNSLNQMMDLYSKPWVVV